MISSSAYKGCYDFKNRPYLNEGIEIKWIALSNDDCVVAGTRLTGHQR